MSTKVAALVDAVRRVDATLPIQTLAVFLDIAENEGTSMVEVAKRLDMTVAGTARNISSLSKWSWLKKKGLDLIVAKSDPMEMRRKILTLTPKGQQLIHEFERILKGR